MKFSPKKTAFNFFSFSKRKATSSVKKSKSRRHQINITEEEEKKETKGCLLIGIGTDRPLWETSQQQFSSSASSLFSLMCHLDKFDFLSFGPCLLCVSTRRCLSLFVLFFCFFFRFPATFSFVLSNGGKI